jgi:hypothetical protein
MLVFSGMEGKLDGIEVYPILEKAEKDGPLADDAV